MPRLSKIGAAALAAFGWTGLQTVSASYLVVAGGAGGGFDRAGGGGAGGYRTGTESLNPTLSYTITVGAGGSGSSAGANKGSNGNNSVFSTITSTGGGGGGSSSSAPGANGGSGGGGRDTGTGTGGSGNTPSTSPSQGNNGGGFGSGAFDTGTGGGGGGAGAVGNAGKATGTGIGGAGTASSISGSSVTYAGGGGGGGGTISGGSAGGSGGGGAGGNANLAGTAGTANLGGGGGGGGDNTGTGGSGGSGIVIISYVGAQQFGGGVVTSSGGSTIHTFTTSGTLSPITTLSASYLIVAGGGGGGEESFASGVGGGGGAGGLLTGSALAIDSSSTYLVTVGAGGASVSSPGTVGNNGSNSSFSMVSTASVGGGGGGGGSSVGTTAVGNGGSGGGGTNSTVSSGGTGTSGQGNSGGTAFPSGGTASISAGGGGGAGAVGSNASSGVGGAGGIGVASSISGTSTYYAGGGGGASGTTAGAGGNGGGGAGATYNVGSGTGGTANLGGGGGGAQNGTGGTASGAGGSGVVIISYAGATQLMAGGTVTISGGNVIHTFTSTGFLAPIDFVNNSLRFRSSASAYLSRTPATAGNRKTWTWSTWYKGAALGGQECLFSVSTGTTDSTFFQLTFAASAGTFHLYLQGYNTTWRATSQVFRDPSAWYHIVLGIDTTQATGSNRIKLYVNGVQVTAFQTNNDPSQNLDLAINQAAQHAIGRNEQIAYYLNGYLTEINFVDGQQLTPSSFGTFNSYGVWQPITYGGSYGTNGFYLPFTNTTSTTTLGYDFSPQGNNWTTNNISLTAGSTYDSMTDVPTLTSATAANYPVLNPLLSAGGTTANGNLQVTTTVGVGHSRPTMAIPASGKWYCEFTAVSAATSSDYIFGIVGIDTPEASYGYNQTPSYSYSAFGEKIVDGSFTASFYSTFTNGDIIGCAVNLDTNQLTWYKNNVAQTAITITNGSYFWMISDASGSRQVTAAFNAGQRPFTYTPPSGFVALNTYNL